MLAMVLVSVDALPKKRRISRLTKMKSTANWYQMPYENVCRKEEKWR